ncbi:uncharacterized protein LOC129593014 [Paramacrobiotus metropolitanus]|uniref:uncharacterized protein LOC129593014 n=1 Tax=Paramacrobiotus metropolitanus TaxID=2943436 RepID=UPI002445D3D6|nr:uncharacterized protein LOC129593014 [Paramacrobiotus metropolitanus]
MGETTQSLTHYHAFRKTYQTGWSRFAQFCKTIGEPPIPATEQTILRFIAQLHLDGLGTSTTIVYLAGIDNAHSEVGISRPSATAAITRAVNGLKRLNMPGTDRRLPITLDMMRSMEENLHNSHLPQQDQLLYWSAFCVAFFGLFRVSELVTNETGKCCPASTLRFSDVILNEDALIITIRSSKTDQFHPGYRITLSATGRSVCPVRSTKAYMDVRITTGKNDPFFILPNGSYVTRHSFERAMKTGLAGVPDIDRYGTHSFRIGGSSAAAANGTSHQRLQEAGRWRSNCYTRYVRNTVPIRGIQAYPL